MSFALTRHLHACIDELRQGALAVAYSGGLDSTALLHALANSQAARARGLRAIHVDHGLDADSAHWAAHCRDAAVALGVPMRVIKVRVERDRGTGLEDAARRARHAAFAEALQPGEILALAQHRGDQAETVLLKLLRGAGPQGLAAMRTLRECGKGYLWRPLLEMPRTALHEYAQAHGLRWIEDPSNESIGLARNFLRHDILPRLARHWPDAEAALAHSAAWLRAAADFIDVQAAAALAGIRGPEPATLDWRGWLALHDALRDPVLRRWLRESNLDEPAHFHVAELERQLRAPAERMPCVAFAATELRRYRALLYAMRTLTPVPHDWEAAWDGSPLPLPAGGTLSAEGAQGDVELIVRYRRGGERLKPAGAAHTRELRALMQEAGVPPWLRARMPLIHAGGELIAVGDRWLSQSGKAWCKAHGAHFVLRPIDSAPPLR